MKQFLYSLTQLVANNATTPDDGTGSGFELGEERN